MRRFFRLGCLAAHIFFFSASPVFSADEGKQCVSCHQLKTPGIVAQWKRSAHAKLEIGCLDCHRADSAEPDAFLHKGVWVTSIPTPKDCARCHEKETAEFLKSHHAQAAQFIGSLDNTLGEIIEGGPAADLGCRQCHGSVVKVIEKGKLDPATWPNTGIGRVNPDGSTGSCSACHYRHTFSAAQARQPENCGKCHMGPDHPQIEIYNESKHGVLFRAFLDEMNLDNPSEKWIAGKDYLFPTCATCHMSRTPTQEVTHDVGARISWTLRPPVSKKLENAEARRTAMQEVCQQCHAREQVGNFYKQYDGAVTLYNDKFGQPAKEAMDALYESGKLTKTPFDEEIEWVYYELWHHEGRRARMGASMQGPDFVQWHGFYEVAKHFYFKFLPLLKEKNPALAEHILSRPEHQWIKGLSPEQIQKTLEFYRKRYQE